MRTPLKMLLFITSPIWIVPAVLIALVFAWYEDFSEWIDEWFEEKNCD